MGLDLSLTIGGDAGQGVESSGAGFSKALMRAGYEVFSLSDYRSRIRGGHNFYQIRIADRPVYSHSDPVHLLLALTPESVDVHLDNVAEQGAVVYDEAFRGVDADRIRAAGKLPVPVPLAAIAQEYGSRVMMNTAALGAAAGLLRLPKKTLHDVIEENFGKKGEKVIEKNRAVLDRGYEAVAGHPFRFRLTDPPRQVARRLLLHGNHAFSLGALLAGCRFVSAYPMTPGTTVFEWMTANAAETGVVTKHAEDEIAAICMAVGAGAVGARALVPTSGGGFSLMVEGLGMAGMCEIPVVIYEAQRGGPSTGLPTRTEQGDLLFALHASQGEFPRVVLAPGTVEEAFEAGWRAFNLAEKYQCPVIVLADQFLASSLRPVREEVFDRRQVRIERGETLRPEECDGLEQPYRRYAFVPTGISPRALPGSPYAVYAMTTDEHDETGHITEDSDNRRRMMEKRMRKLDACRAEMRPPRWYGPEEADLTLICWGSTYGPAREAVDLLRAGGEAVNLLHFSDIWPFPAQAAAELAKTRRTVVVEQNYTGQFAHFLRMHLLFDADATLHKYDGRPFSPQEIVAGLREEAFARA